jgi:uncharacterized membrane protein
MIAPGLSGSYYVALRWVQGHEVDKNVWLIGFKYITPVALISFCTQIIGHIALWMKPHIPTDSFTTVFAINYAVSLLINFLLVFAPLFIVDQQQNVLVACGSSIKLFGRHFFSMLIIYIIVMVLLFLSAVLLLVGLVWVLPWLTLVGAILYASGFVRS